MKHARREHGLTVVELLVAGFILVIVLAAAATFFAQQISLQRSVQARNEVQEHVRVAMQLATQDLSLAGNSVLIDASTGGKNTAVSWPFCFDGGRGCVETEVADTTSTPADVGTSILRVRYVSSQFPAAEACRDVEYRVASGVLQRSDVVCGGTTTFVDLAPNILGFQVGVICSTGTSYETFPVAACGSGTSYARSATVSLSGQATSTAAGATCATGRVCFDLAQETLIPNMKDK